MDHVFLGATGVKVSRLAFGTMSFGGDADEATSAALFSRCLDAGVNLFDCADIYSKGRAEEILGKLLSGKRDDVVLTTKAYFPTGDGPNDRGSSRYHLVRAVEASLRRLDTDRIDVYFLHRFDEATDLEESLRAIEDLVRAGKILYPAVSNFSAWQAMKALGLQRARGFTPLVALQPQYSLAKRQAEVEILPMAASERLAVFPYSPLGGGLLTGKFGASERPAEGRLVTNEMYKKRFGDSDDYALAERFRDFAKERGIHPVTLAVAWVMHHPAVTAPLLGARNVAQLEPALAAAELAMDAELRDAVSALSRDAGARDGSRGRGDGGVSREAVGADRPNRRDASGGRVMSSTVRRALTADRRTPRPEAREDVLERATHRARAGSTSSSSSEVAFARSRGDRSIERAEATLELTSKDACCPVTESARWRRRSRASPPGSGR